MDPRENLNLWYQYYGKDENNRVFYKNLDNSEFQPIQTEFEQVDNPENPGYVKLVPKNWGTPDVVSLPKYTNGNPEVSPSKTQTGSEDGTQPYVKVDDLLGDIEKILNEYNFDLPENSEPNSPNAPAASSQTDQNSSANKQPAVWPTEDPTEPQAPLDKTGFVSYLIPAVQAGEYPIPADPAFSSSAGVPAENGNIQNVVLSSSIEVKAGDGAFESQLLNNLD